jgi:hypothetical protein
MNLIKKTLTLLLPVVTWGCQPGNGEKGQPTTTYSYNFNLVENKIRKIFVDSTTKDKFGNFRTRYWENSHGKSIIAMLNDNTNRIQLYDWDTGLAYKFIQLQAEGPDGVGKPRGLAVFNDSTFLLAHRYANTVFLVDHDGRIRRKFKLQPHDSKNANPKKESYQYSAEPYLTIDRPVFQVDSKIILSAFPDLNWHEPGFFEHGRVAIVVDTVTNHFAYHVKYPTVYQGKESLIPDNYLDVSWAHDPQSGKITLSYPGDVNLYVTDTNFKEFEAHEIKSRFTKELIRFKSRPEVDDAAFYAENYCFGSLFYDPYRKVYYRFVTLQTRPTKLPTAAGDVIDAPQASVIIINDQYQVIGETQLPYPLGFLGGIVIDREGLWIEGENLEAYVKQEKVFKSSEDDIVLTLFTLHEDNK